MGLLSTFIRKTQQAAPVSEAGEDAPRFRRGDCAVFAAGRGECFLAVARQNWLVPECVARFVMSCGRFRTASAHLESTTDADVVREWLPQLFDIGALVTEELFIGPLAAPVSFERRLAPVQSIGVFAGGSTEDAMKTVRSFGANARRYHRPMEFTVFAVETDEDSCAQFRAMASEMDIPVRLVGSDERSRFVDRLAARSVLPVEIALSALGNGTEWSTAQGLNAAILSNPRRKVVWVRAGTSCDLFAVEAGSEAVSFSPTTNEMAGFGVPTERDFLALHERFLERRLGECLPGYGSTLAVEIEDADAEVLDRLGTGDQRVIATTQARNAAATGQVHFILDLDESPVIGLDGSGTIPPFLPLGNSCGKASSALIRRCIPGAWIARLPVSACNPDAEHSVGSDDHLGISDLVAQLVETAPVITESSGFAMECVGRRLIEVSELTEEAFRILLARCSTEILSRRDPDLHREELLAGDPGGLWENRNGEPEPDIRETLAQCGQLLVGWPSLLRAADELRRMAQPIWITP